MDLVTIIAEPLQIDGEYILWMYHMKYFVEIFREFQVKVKFQNSEVFLEGQSPINVRLARKKIQDHVNSYGFDFLLASNEQYYDYGPYIQLMKNQEYRQLTNQYKYLWFYTKKQYNEQLHSLSIRYAYNAKQTNKLPHHFVMVWVPQNQFNQIMNQLFSIIENIKKSLESQKIPKFNFNYQVNPESFIQLVDFQVLQLYTIYDINGMQKKFNIHLGLIESNNQLKLKIQSNNQKDLSYGKQYLQQIFNTKSFGYLNVNKSIYSLQQLQEFEKYLEIMFPKLLIIQKKEVERTMNELDQQYQLNLKNRLEPLFPRYINFYFVQALSDQINEIQELAIKYFIPVKDTPNQVVNIQINKIQTPPPINTFKNYIINRSQGQFIVQYYNTQDNKYNLHINALDLDQLKQNFDQFVRDRYTLPYIINLEAKQGVIKFILSQEDIVQINENDQQNQLESNKVNKSEVNNNANINNLAFQGNYLKITSQIQSQIIEFLEEYMNQDLTLILNFRFEENQNQNLNKILYNFNCSLQICYCETKEIGWLQYIDEKWLTSSNGSCTALCFTNLIQSLVPQFKQSVDIIVDHVKQQEQIVMALSESQINQLNESKKFKILEPLFENIEKYYWVQCKRSDTDIQIDKLKFLEQEIYEKHIINIKNKFNNANIIETQNNQNMIFYDIFIEEQHQQYYRKQRRFCLNKMFSIDNYQKYTQQFKEYTFYINVTNLQIQPINLIPIIMEISNDEVHKQMDKPEILKKLTDLSPGIYLLGRFRLEQSSTKIDLKNEENYIIKYENFRYQNSSIIQML